ncbi:uncharacterized protein LOC141667590 [Apium graveolens]|uniref:uncharacterized protein LOC141667590 n=1 Tax=Apium graveolens TaxID=4045 RepID=UPI003D7A0C47
MSCVVYVILFLSLHACKGRSLGLHTNKGDFTGMNVHNSNLQHFGDGELQAQENNFAETGQSNIEQSLACAVPVKENPFEETLTKKITKGWRRQALSTSGSEEHEFEGTADPNGKDIIEDVVVMDYAQPHRKPPIHNIKD